MVMYVLETRAGVVGRRRGEPLQRRRAVELVGVEEDGLNLMNQRPGHLQWITTSTPEAEGEVEGLQRARLAGENRGRSPVRFEGQRPSRHCQQLLGLDLRSVVRFGMARTIGEGLYL